MASSSSAAATALRQFDELENETTLMVNDHTIKFQGVGNANLGQLTSHVSHSFRFPIEILAPMLIVGYPTYSEYKDSATDLFKPSTLLGGYKYQRAYRFSNGVTFSSFHNITYDADKNCLNGVFSTLNFPEAAFSGDWKVGDLVETFIPHAPGIIKSIMAVEWFGGSRSQPRSLHAIIESEYYFNHNKMLPCLHWRHVKFHTSHTKGVYTQSEKITVTRNFDFGPVVVQGRGQGQTGRLGASPKRPRKSESESD